MIWRECPTTWVNLDDTVSGIPQYELGLEERDVPDESAVPEPPRPEDPISRLRSAKRRARR